MLYGFPLFITPAKLGTNIDKYMAGSDYSSVTRVFPSNVLKEVEEVTCNLHKTHSCLHFRMLNVSSDDLLIKDLKISPMAYSEILTNPTISEIKLSRRC
jgi:hypothetical protein